MDLSIIAECFVVTVVGGMGSVPGALLAALLIGQLNAFGILVFPKITLVLTFLLMAAVLVVRPYGLLGRPDAPAPPPASMIATLRPWTAGEALLALAVSPRWPPCPSSPTPTP
jgi:branched-chain amino acid transport system permease protein